MLRSKAGREKWLCCGARWCARIDRLQPPSRRSSIRNAFRLTVAIQSHWRQGTNEGVAAPAASVEGEIEHGAQCRRVPRFGGTTSEQFFRSLMNRMEERVRVLGGLFCRVVLGSMLDRRRTRRSPQWLLAWLSLWLGGFLASVAVAWFIVFIATGHSFPRQPARAGPDPGASASSTGR